MIAPWPLAMLILRHSNRAIFLAPAFDSPYSVAIPYPTNHLAPHFSLSLRSSSYGDVLDSAKGWAASLRFNPSLLAQLEAFYRRPDTFSLGVCNGCQLMALLGWVSWGMRAMVARGRRGRSISCLLAFNFGSASSSLSFSRSLRCLVQEWAG